MSSTADKIPFRINPSFWILAALIAWVGSSGLWQFASWIVVVFVSVVVHEMGHALLARMWGQNVQIVLGPLGGATIYGASKEPLTRLKEFIVVLSGPLFGFILAGVSFLLLSRFQPGIVLGYFLYCMTLANIVWSIFNLLPVHPFDGGKLMSIVFEGIFGVAGMRLSYILSAIFALLLAGFFLYAGQLFAGALLILCAFESFRNYRERRYFHTTANEQQFDALEDAKNAFTQNRPDEAIDSLKKLIDKTKEGEVHQEAILQLAHYLAATKKTEEAYRLLHAQKRLEPQALKLLQLLAYNQGFWQEALDTGNRLFRELQDPSSAVLCAFAAAHLGDVKTSLNWVSAVKKSKAIDMQALLASHDFDNIRNDPSFKLL